MSQTLIKALQNPALFDHPVESFKLIETHISWVILTGSYAYKIKKPFDFEFLDFSTLAKRKHFCHEEVRLNRRHAPNLYLDVIPIYGSETSPDLKGSGEPIEYAIKMLQFPQEALLSNLLQQGELSLKHIDEIAKTMADFHNGIAVAEADTRFGTPEQVMKPVTQNFEQILPFLEEGDDINQLKHIEAWAKDSFEILKPQFVSRKAQGKIRECHGDLHLGNIVLIDDRVTLFDCIEFNEEFRWFDVMGEVAFFTMDLEDKGLTDYSQHFLNQYLEHTGDFDGLKVINFYKSYFALVRAKVTLLQLHSPDISNEQRAAIYKTYRSYTELATQYMAIPNPYLLLMHGFSGTGKTTVSNQLVDRLGAIRLRSDVERKRLFSSQTTGDADINQGIYSHAASDQTFDHLTRTAEIILDSGHAVILDATFLHKAYRDLFHRLAEEKGVPLRIISCELSDERIRNRIQRRQTEGADASDADIAVYESQLQSADPLSESELTHTSKLNTESREQIENFIESIGQ